MISAINIKDYKSINDIKLNIKKLNVLSGINSSGKSSTIQALLMAADNITQDGSEHSLIASHVLPSSFNESRNYITNAKKYSVIVCMNDEDVCFDFLPKDDRFIGTTVQQTGRLSDKNTTCLKNLFYLSAMRTGDLGNPKINPNPDQNLLGVHGEYIIDYFYSQRKELLPDCLISYNESRTLEGQVNYWLQKLSGYSLSVELLDSEYKVRFMPQEKKATHPYNVGTGVNFIAETLIACLVTPLGGCVIIENPEIHLHPAAQSEMLDFLAGISNAGIQVIIETHSDHYFNGIRRSIKKGTICAEDVAVYFFKKEGGLTQAVPINISQYGGIENYEPGMFDQFDKDLDEILG